MVFSKNDIIECLHNIGIFIDDCNDDEVILLRNYIEDSIMFVSFIVELEEKFDIEIPDEYLLITEMETIDDVCNVINNIKKDIDFNT